MLFFMGNMRPSVLAKEQRSLIFSHYGDTALGNSFKLIYVEGKYSQTSQLVKLDQVADGIGFMHIYVAHV